MAFIDIVGIAKTFRRPFTRLRGVDLAVEEREFITLLGPSGCGKTTMLRTLAGFLTPDAGTIQVAGRLLSSPQARAATRAAPHGHGVPELRGVAAHVGVRERGLRAAACQARRRRDRATGWPRAGGGRPGGATGPAPEPTFGRPAAARGAGALLVVEPTILLLDEPLSNLDAKLRERMRSELKTLQRRTGITFIYVTHDQAEAMALVGSHRGVQPGRRATGRHAARGLRAARPTCSWPISWGW